MSCPNLEVAGQAFIKAFQEFAGKGEDKTLTKDELYQLTVKEYPTMFGNKNKEDIMNTVSGLMVRDRDDKVNLQEYVLFNSYLIMTLQPDLLRK